MMRCKACGDQSVTPKYDMDEWKAWVCNGCGFVEFFGFLGFVEFE